MKIIKKFISYYQPYKVLFFADMLCALLISLIDLSFPQLLKFFNNNLFQQDSSIIINSLSLIAFALVAGDVTSALTSVQFPQLPLSS